MTTKEIIEKLRLFAERRREHGDLLNEAADRLEASEALLEACRSAIKVVSEIADIDAENRAGWSHKQLSDAIAQAEKANL